MAEFVLVTGGSRSGKSQFAEEYVLERSENPAYIATAIPFDEEMQQRVKVHQERRGNQWTVYDAPTDISDIRDFLGYHDSILVDSLSMMVFNVLFQMENDFDHLTRNRRAELEKKVLEQIEELFVKLVDFSGIVVIVTDEIGLGIVPETSLSRLYRDIVGYANQMAAKRSKDVFLIVSGIPIKIKG